MPWIDAMTLAVLCWTHTHPCAKCHSKVLFSHECAIYRSAPDRNVVFWSKENPYFTQEMQHALLDVMIWAGLTSAYLNGPYFFHEPVKAASYLAMLQTWLKPQLRGRGPMDDVWLQHDRAHACFSLSMRDVLNENSPDRWIRRGSPTPLAKLTWPQRRPDLTTSVNSLWGTIKGRVVAGRYANKENLRRAVDDVFSNITPQML
jgi:hypothetical protein